MNGGDGLEQSQDVERTIAEPRDRPRIETEVAPPRPRRESRRRERRAPLIGTPVVVRKAHTVMRVADPIHEPERRRGTDSLAHVVFDDHAPTRRACRFTQQRSWILGMMQYVDEEHRVHRTIGKRNRSAVELPHRNRGIFAHENVDPLERAVFAHSLKLGGQTAVPAPDIEYVRARRQYRRNQITQTAKPPAENETIVDVTDKTHRRRSPSTLRKKLKRMVWNPSVVLVMPGITQRMVCP